MKSTPFHLHRLILILTAGYLLTVSCTAAAAGTALRLDVKGGIGPATRDYVLNGIEYAQETGAEVVILEMDTPGGLDSAMRDIIKGILASSVPVVTYVSPSGSRAASAGTYILYASHVAAMAPATTLGAATPVQIGGGAPSPPIPGDEQDDGADQTADDIDTDPLEDDSPRLSGTAMERKAVNDAAAYIRGLAELRSRNAEWAERAVREAVSLTAEAALEKNVIDIIAVNVPELMEGINGMPVTLGNKAVDISTDNLMVENYEPDWRTRLLMVITDPNIAYLLMLVGVYGLMLEGYNPGAFVPGIVGAICLLLALFAFQVLPVNYAGLGLIALGIALMIAEAFAPSFGALGLGGIAAFVFGSVILMDTDVPGFTISRALIATVATVGGVLLLALVLFLIRSRRRRVTSGAAGMLGEAAEVLENFSTTGAVLVRGERWQAKTSRPVAKGQVVRVTDFNGLVLKVEPQDGQA
jgi:membrane-bound serine protease (ClpP class)